MAKSTPVESEIMTFAARYPKRIWDLIDMGALLFLSPRNQDILIQVVSDRRNFALLILRKDWIREGDPPCDNEEGEFKGIEYMLVHRLKEEVLRFRQEQYESSLVKES